MRSEFVPKTNGSGNIVSRAQQAGHTPDGIIAENPNVPACRASLSYNAESGHLVTFFPEDGDFAEKKRALLQQFSDARAVVPESLYNALASAEHQCLFNGNIAWIRAVAVMLNHTLIHPSDRNGELIKSGSGFAHPYAWRYIAEAMGPAAIEITGEWSYTGTKVGSTFATLGIHVQPQDSTKQIVTFAKFGPYSGANFAPTHERWPTYDGNAYYQERYLNFNGDWYDSSPKKYIEDENCERGYFNNMVGLIQPYEGEYPITPESAVFLVDGTNAFTSYELDLPPEYSIQYGYRFFRAYSAYDLVGWGVDLASPFKRDSILELRGYSWHQLKNWVDTSVREAGHMWTLWDEIFQHIDARVIGEYNTTNVTGKALFLDAGDISNEILVSSSAHSLEAFNDDPIGEFINPSDGGGPTTIAYFRRRIEGQSASDKIDCITLENRDSLAYDTILDHFTLHARNVDATISLNTDFPAPTIWDSLEPSKKLELLHKYFNGEIPNNVVTITKSWGWSSDVRVVINDGAGEMHFTDGTTYIHLSNIIAAMGLPLDITTVDQIADILRGGISLTFKLNEGLSGPDPGVHKSFIFGGGSITGDPINEWLDV